MHIAKFSNESGDGEFKTLYGKIHSSLKHLSILGIICDAAYQSHQTRLKLEYLNADVNANMIMGNNCKADNNTWQQRLAI